MITHYNNGFDITPINSQNISTITAGAVSLLWSLIAPGNLLAMVTTLNDHHCGNSCSRSNSWLVKLFQTEKKDDREGARGGRRLSVISRQTGYASVSGASPLNPSNHLTTHLSIFHFFCPFLGSFVSFPLSPLYSHQPLCLIASFWIDN